MLITIEGVDGAGKRTLARGLQEEFIASGYSVLAMAFPRYGQSVTADVAAEALQGQHGDIATSVYAMAMLFALDRAEARDQIAAACAGDTIVIADRYVASNAAYSAARLHQDASGAVVQWVQELEYGRFRLPTPDRHILVDTAVGLAGERAAHRADTEAGRVRDAYERDDGLQRRTRAVYVDLAARSWGGSWLVVRGDRDAADVAALAAQLVQR